MKSVILLVTVLCISFALGLYTDGDNGQPKCTDSEELKRPWRNNFDPTFYWVCEKVNIPAVRVPCPPGTGFIDTPEVFGCINWDAWLWIIPENPPSKH